MTLQVLSPGSGDTVAAGPMRVRILEDGRLTSHRLGLVEVTIPPHVDGPPQHVHREHDETFYVISGTPSFTSGSDTTLVQPGGLVTAPPGEAHTFANPGDTTVVLLCTVTPDRYIDYFRELDRLPKSPAGLDPAAVAEIMARYATEVVRG